MMPVTLSRNFQQFLQDTHQNTTAQISSKEEKNAYTQAITTIYTCIGRYTFPSSLSDKIKYIAYRIWNAVKAIFGGSDWQHACQLQKEFIMKRLNRFDELEEIKAQPLHTTGENKKDVDKILDILGTTLHSTLRPFAEEFLRNTLKINRLYLGYEKTGDNAIQDRANRIRVLLDNNVGNIRQKLESDIHNAIEEIKKLFNID